jgi:hypothetical protein
MNDGDKVRRDRINFLTSLGVALDSHDGSVTRVLRKHGLADGRLESISELAWRVRLRDMLRLQRYGIEKNSVWLEEDC